MSTPVPSVTRLRLGDLDRLLALRPSASGRLVALALGRPTPPPEPGPVPDAELPTGADVVIGDVLTSADALVSIGTASARAALLAVGRDRVLLLVPDGEGIEVAALATTASVGDAAAAIADRVGPAAVVMVAVPSGDVTTLAPGPDLARAVQELAP